MHVVAITMATTDRRNFLTSALVFVAGTSAAAAAPRSARLPVTPIEALTREHGILRRVMYLYDEAADRLEAEREVPLDGLGSCAATLRRVIEDVHERLEEELVFPLCTGPLADLTAVLGKQHAAGRALTDRVLCLMKGATADRADLIRSLRAFTRMYRPHADREDTVVFPALRELVGANGYRDLAERLAERSRQLLGERDGEQALDDVARLERAFGVDDLSKLTA